LWPRRALDVADVDPALEEMRGRGVSQDVGRHLIGDLGLPAIGPNWKAARAR
jgi:hypothetical protein